ncbi:hypothetical protein SAMN06273572_1011171 [Monaibacterium marinum]|uniref:Uncharacterized protein n=1 Tax=Pontivivens marinum TaxID=1690039 RepID=A0A2C9CQ55_9RHOB|nr:DUF6173 family protein [Monaibacterium marinum]SOH93315.1 hypothetical protein SAMN06273572_1011171 [Monaibacterium marinum]
MDGKVSTSAEAAENAVLAHGFRVDDLPAAEEAERPETLKGDAGKSPAQWAYERIINYIQKFEEGLDAEHEVGMGFVGSESGTLTIQGMGYFAPDIITFYGSDAAGSKRQLIQHVSQLSVMLTAAPRLKTPAQRIGFRLAAELERKG